MDLVSNLPTSSFLIFLILTACSGANQPAPRAGAHPATSIETPDLEVDWYGWFPISEEAQERLIWAEDHHAATLDGRLVVLNLNKARGLTRIEELRGAVGIQIDGDVLAEPSIRERLQLRAGPIALALYHPERRITDVTLTHLEGFTKVERLFLVGTEVTDRGLAHLAALPRLRMLNLNGTQVVGDGLSHLGNLAHLEILVLDSTRLSDASMASLARLSSLRFLSAGGNRLTGEGLSHLANLERLEGLFLSETGINDAGLQHLTTGFARLETLALERTRVTDRGLAHLSNLRRLKELYLDGTQVTNAGLAHLSEMTELEVLCVGETQVDEAPTLPPNVRAAISRCL